MASPSSTSSLISTDDLFDQMIDFMVAEREDLDDDNQSDLSISSVDTSDLSDFEEISSSDEEIDDGEEWSDTVRDHDLHHFRSHSGPKIPLNFDAKPIDYFLQLFPEDLMRKIVYETNLYAQQKGATNFEPTCSVHLFFPFYFIFTLFFIFIFVCEPINSISVKVFLTKTTVARMHILRARRSTLEEIKHHSKRKRNIMSCIRQHN